VIDGERRQQAFEAVVADHWNGFRKGLEKEGLRVDADGFIAQTPHPEALGSALTNPAITTDYSEALLELVTPVCESTEELLGALDGIHSYVHQHLGDEVLWPLSMPCRLDGDASIPIAHYGTSNIGTLKTVYRRGLAERYGRMMQSIAGTHYNFSMPDSFWENWQKQLGDTGPLSEFRTQQYFWLIRNFRRRSWLLMYLFGASPALDKSFVEGRRHRLDTLDNQTLYEPYATSLRMSDLGYNNQAQSSLDICFNRQRPTPRLWTMLFTRAGRPTGKLACSAMATASRSMTACCRSRTSTTAPSGPNAPPNPVRSRCMHCRVVVLNMWKYVAWILIPLRPRGYPGTGGLPGPLPARLPDLGQPADR